ncbi:NUDIX domain-containing protein [Mycoplasmopsis caviae]|uniref:NUDIX domain n=1 Tax=Mycoplasmopsis caviae TaxID=55603 RepID=A0A3P8LAB6_9BACT|nr:NUDIX domain-containing protein [Mycoplasmopsis caviae]UUD35663.1 NUDIX domain-containing protein [Mycoplasmopsis caviae]VDR41591.1 NUDIX domain [Mycoplasmopsis caviae]
MSEKSCGLVIFRKFKKGWKVLILKQTNNVWSFAKGHVEGNENEIETALRETSEEVNLNNFKYFSENRISDHYTLQNGNLKEDVYFLAIQLDDKEPIKQESEVLKVKYYPISRAKNKFVYYSQKKILVFMYSKLKEYLSSQNR